MGIAGGLVKDPPPKVTDLELTILQQIWEARDARSVSQILASWPHAKRPGYTTVLKTLQKMEAKGIVGHREEGKRYAYFSRVDREEVLERRLKTIVDRLFGGNRVSFAHYFIESSDLSADELQELKRLVTQRKKEQSK